MTRHVTQLLIAVLLLVGAFASWRLANRTRELAAAAERRLTFVESSEYWSGRYDAVAEQATADRPESLVMAANAAFRKAQRDAMGGAPAERLDQVMQAYASALKNGGFNRDAAFNFEYVARLRDAARTPRRAPPPSAPRAPAPADDLPAGATLHGRPGMHPPNTRGEDFEVLTPMDYGERETRPDSTPGRPLPRKG
jgi:hypothetical protein